MFGDTYLIPYIHTCTFLCLYFYLCPLIYMCVYLGLCVYMWDVHTHVHTHISIFSTLYLCAYADTPIIFLYIPVYIWGGVYRNIHI